MLSPVLPAQIDLPKMSVEKLRARIVELDSEIELQKKLLEKLETDRICVLRQLNAALDPVARLPREISSEIFLLPLAPSPTGKQDVPTALLRISNAWTDIALSTPRLWTTIHIHFPCGDDFAELLPIWFRRTRMHRLSISISLCGPSRNWNHRVSDVLWRHGALFKHLEILDDDLDADDDDLNSYDDNFSDLTPGEESRAIDLFQDTTSVSLWSLQTLEIHCQSGQRIYNASQILNATWRTAAHRQKIKMVAKIPNLVWIDTLPALKCPSRSFVQLDSDIELQKKVLEKLEKDRAVVKRQLNAALDR
ncbi:hypothetical protein C8R45DRAFT_1157400 [Mycena sanguinolenta]|nr:hypothetical protein C8R45DRAFT_1157400 [Mycena sanguinolenta]